MSGAVDSVCHVGMSARVLLSVVCAGAMGFPDRVSSISTNSGFHPCLFVSMLSRSPGGDWLWLSLVRPARGRCRRGLALLVVALPS